MNAPRIPCCVPFCRRTAPNAGKFAGCSEIICGKHWRLARRDRRRLYSRLRRELDRGPREPWLLPPGSHPRIRANKVRRVALRLWDRIKAEAIQAAAGIA